MAAVLALTVGAPMVEAQYEFSHDTATNGIPPGAVFAGPDIQDVFESDLLVGDLITMETNTLKVDNAAGFGLQAGDNVDALCDDGTRPTAPFDGVYNPNFVFSVKPGAVGELGTPVNLQMPFNGADVFNFLGQPNGHGAVNFDDQMDLDAANVNESIDGIHIFEDATEFDPGSRVHFSLTAGSPTLVANGWSGADILTTVIGSGVVKVAINSEEIGLAGTDDLDGLVMFGAFDVNADGDLMEIGEVFQVWFTVNTGSAGLVGTDVRAGSTGNGVHGDVFFSGGAGANFRFYDSIFWTKLDPGDVIDALDIAGDLIGPSVPPPDLPLPPMVLPLPLRPFCGGWIGICNGNQPKNVTAQLILNLVDSSGAPIAFPKQEKAFKANPFSPTAACDKATMMATFLRTRTITLGGEQIPLFDNESIRIGDPDAHFKGVAQIEKELCVRLSPAFAATGISIRHFGLSMTNWTGGFISEEYNWTTPMFRMYRLSMDESPTAAGVLRASFGDSFGGLYVVSTPFSAGEDPTDVMQRMIDQINSDGGEACFDFPDPIAGVPTEVSIVIARAPLEPPLQGTQFGPYLEEFGANGNDVKVTLMFEARTARVVCPLTPTPPTAVPTLNEWGVIFMSLLFGALGMAFLQRRALPAVAGSGQSVGATGQEPLLDAPLFARCLLGLGVAAVLGVLGVSLRLGPIGSVDLVGLSLCVPVAAWMLQLFIGSRRSS